MAFKGVHYGDLKDKVGFIPVVADEIAKVTPAFFNAIEMLESENDKNAIKDFCKALGIVLNDEGMGMGALGLFDVRALSKKYLAAKRLESIAEECDYEFDSEDEADEIVDKAANLDGWKKATDGNPALYEAIQDYLPEEEEEDEDEEEDDCDDCDGSCGCNDDEENKKEKVFTFVIHALGV